MTVSILAGFVALTCLVSRINGQCTQEAVDECSKKLSDSAHDVNAAVMPFLNESDAREHCEHYKYFENCLRPIKPHCGVSERLTFEGQEKAYKWWCEDLFDVYLNHNQCFQNVELHNTADACLNDYADAVQKALDLSDGGQYSDGLDKYCRGSLSYLDCIEADVTDHCNDPTAGHWQRGLDERLLSNRLKYVGCVVGGYWIMKDRKEAFPHINVYQFPHDDGSDRTTLRSISEEVYDPSRCSSQTLNHCMLELADAGHDVNEAVVPFLTEDEAREHCRLYYQFETCWEPAKENCSPADKRYFAATELVYDWWCRDLFNEYLEHQPCLNNEELHREGDYCKSYINTRIDSASSDYQNDGDAVLYIKKICHYIEHYLDCVENAVKHHCEDVDAAKWQRGFDERSYLPMAEHIGCVADNKWVVDGSPFPSVTVEYFNEQKGSDHIAILVAVLCVSILLFLLVILVASTLFYLRKRKLKMTNDRRSNINEAPPPPPYVLYASAQGNAHVNLGMDHVEESTDDNDAKQDVATEQGHADANGNVASRPGEYENPLYAVHESGGDAGDGGAGGEGRNYQRF